MKTLQQGSEAPNFSLPTETGQFVKLADFKGRYLVLYFYPRDNTPGCTVEAKDFSRLKDEFSNHNCEILGVSRDSVKKHQNFIAKQDLTIRLGADIAGQVTEDYGVWVEKKLYGKTYMGIERATFLIDPSGNIAQVWRKVKVKTHAEDVLEAVKSAQA